MLVGLSKKKQIELVNLAPFLVSEFQFKGIGCTTIFHLLKNLGIDIFKPDIHVRRLLTSIGIVRDSNASLEEICNAMERLSSLSSLRINKLDTLLFYYGQAIGDALPISLSTLT